MVTPDGRRVNSQWTEDASLAPGTQEYSNRIKADTKQYGDMISDLRTQFGTFGTGDDQQFATELAPAVAGNKVAKWAIENKIPPEYWVVLSRVHIMLPSLTPSNLAGRYVTSHHTSTHSMCLLSLVTLSSSRIRMVLSSLAAR